MDIMGTGMRRRVAAVGLAPSLDLARHVLRDGRVRANARRAAERAVTVHRELARSEDLGRLARDRRLQRDVAALVRATAAAVDAGAAAARRQARRRFLRIAIVTGGLAGLLTWAGAHAVRQDPRDDWAIGEGPAEALVPVERPVD